MSTLCAEENSKGTKTKDISIIIYKEHTAFVHSPYLQ